MPRKMLSPYHPHALFEKTLAGGICDACCGKIPLGYLFRCQCCNLNLDDGCILYEATRKELRHFSHFHPLETVVLDGNVLSYLCAICQTYCIGPTCTCKRCHFYLHQQCSKLELPQEVQHPRHPCLLTLRTKGAYLWPFFEDTILYYECENCNFKMDVGEGVSLAEIFEGQKRFRHFSHRHPLVFSEQNEEFGQVNCSACGKPCSALTYVCTTCQFFLHQSCIDLPLQIRHILHPSPLTLCIQPRSFSCGDCGRGAVLRSFYFYCKWCDFGMDIECALLTTVKDQTQRQFFHFAHGHPLTLTEIKDEDEISCSSCRRCCSGPAFVCSKCSFILDKSCFELPRKIQHSFHPSHPLTFLAQPFKLEWACNVCCKNITGFSYCCGKCDFKMHNECTQLSPTVSYKGHHHLLHFLDKLDSQVECKTCDSPCDAHVFRCAECNFNLHLLCGPLPCTIRHEYYDPLLLTDSPCQDDTYQFYCDACEKERKPWLPVYHCKDYHFIAEIECVMSEVILTLQGKYGDVELRTLDGGLCGKVVTEKLEAAVTEQNSDEQVEELEKIWPVLTLDDMFSSFSEAEKMELNSTFAGFERETVEAKERSSIDKGEEGDDSLEVSFFSDRAYEHFMEMLDSSTMFSSSTLGQQNRHFTEMLNSAAKYSSLTLSKYKSKVQNGKDNMFSLKLATFMQELKAKYGDISLESTLSPQVKTYLIVMLCGTLHSMNNTRIIDISEDLLFTWRYNLKFLKSARFKVQFAGIVWRKFHVPTSDFMLEEKSTKPWQNLIEKSQLFQKK